MSSAAQAFGWRVFTSLMAIATMTNTALGGDLVSAVSGGAATVAFALCALSCTVEARAEETHTEEAAR